MNNQEIVSKLWNLCNVLRDDGITYHQYVTELTYILFLKMSKETGTDKQIPEAYRWNELIQNKVSNLNVFTPNYSTTLAKIALAVFVKFTTAHVQTLRNLKTLKNYH